MKRYTRILLLVTIVGFAGAGFAQPTFALTPRRLDGVMVAKSEANLWPVAVMIDNHTAARPQASLGRASVIYEALAEGGIPRFMAVFARNDLKLVGPVRSTRPYFVKYAAEYRAAMAHAGGSRDGLLLLGSLHMPNIEGLKGSTAKYFYRIGSGVHTLFTNSTKITSALKSLGYSNKKPNFESWKFKREPLRSSLPKGSHGASVDLGYGQSYKIRFEFDRVRNIYRRFTGNRAHLDRVTRKQLYAKNVILLRVPHERVLDYKGRLDLKVIGSGKAVLLQDGKATNIRWNKSSTLGRTRFTALHGNKPVLFNPGLTWIVVVPDGHPFSTF